MKVVKRWHVIHASFALIYSLHTQVHHLWYIRRLRHLCELCDRLSWRARSEVCKAWQVTWQHENRKSKPRTEQGWSRLDIVKRDCKLRMTLIVWIRTMHSDVALCQTHSLISNVNMLYFMGDITCILFLTVSWSQFWGNWTEGLKWGAYSVPRPITKCQGSSANWRLCIQDFVSILLHRTCEKISVKPFIDTVWCSLNDTFFFRIPGKNVWPTSCLIFPDFFVIAEQVQVECCVNWSAEIAGQRHLGRSQ